MASFVAITGASRGIGFELAKRFAKDGNQLLLVARSEGELQRICESFSEEFGVFCRYVVADLSTEKGVQTLIDFVEKEDLQVSTLVNNAGFGHFESFLKSDWEKESAMIDLNVKALTKLSKFFGNHLKKQKVGRILNVASMAGFIPGPGSAVYYATKSYVQSFSQALVYELKPDGIQVSVLCPGPVKTDFAKEAEAGNMDLFAKGGMKVEKVADIAYRDFLKGKTLIVPGWKNKLMLFATRLVPRKFASWMSARSLQ
jgi:hypothetical protein